MKLYKKHTLDITLNILSTVPPLDYCKTSKALKFL